MACGKPSRMARRSRRWMGGGALRCIMLPTLRSTTQPRCGSCCCTPQTPTPRMTLASRPSCAPPPTGGWMQCGCCFLRVRTLSCEDGDCGGRCTWPQRLAVWTASRLSSRLAPGPRLRMRWETRRLIWPWLPATRDAPRFWMLPSGHGPTRRMARCPPKMSTVASLTGRSCTQTPRWQSFRRSGLRRRRERAGPRHPGLSRALKALTKCYKRTRTGSSKTFRMTSMLSVAKSTGRLMRMRRTPMTPSGRGCHAKA
mmetsp:Transcript_62272/g.148912  ORF Transcript_62272/g.148912 Transcript_62272/m.148912 type:complete len:255 (+) Transcript_62272:649-1413(+)